MPHPIDEYIGERIREERLKARMTQIVLAERIGVSFQQLQKYENAQNRISGSRIWLLAQALEVSVSRFFPPDKDPDAIGARKLRGAVDLHLAGRVAFPNDEQKTSILDLNDTMKE